MPISPVIKKALVRWKLAEEAESEIRKRGLEDDKFLAGDQWPTNVKESREIEQRPCLTVNRMPQFVRQVTNDARMNRPSIKIAPTQDANLDKAKVMEGLIRNIQVASNAEVAYDTACYSQVAKGWGYIRVITKYCDEKSFDQDIEIKPIKNAFTVYVDPTCVEPDYSDMKWCFIVADEDREDFKDKYPDATTTTFASIGDNPSSWLSEKYIRVAEYFEVVEKKITIHLLADGTTATDDELKDFTEQTGQPAPDVQNSRESTEKKVIWRKISCCDILEGGEEGQEWAGKYIPIVPVLGDDINIDGKRDLVGMVRYATDPQRMYNYWVTAETEAIALAPKSPFVGAEGQFEGYETLWQNANIKNNAYLTYKPTTVAGQLVGPPQRITTEPPIQAMAMAIRQCADDMKSTTGIYDASLGSGPSDTSGIAIQRRQKEGDVANFNYIDNLARAIRHIGVIIVDLIPKIYDAPRVVKILQPDSQAEMVVINQEFVEKGQQKKYDLTIGKYDIVVETGPSFMTQRQEAASNISDLAKAYPPLMQFAGDILVKNMDWPQAQDVADRLKKMLPPQLQESPDGQPPVPPAIQQKLQQSQQMISMLTKAVNHAHDVIDSKTQELESKERIAAQNNQTDIVVAQVKAGNEANVSVLQAELEHREALLGMQQQITSDIINATTTPPVPQNSPSNAPNPTSQPLTAPQASPSV